jgi:hypothetical protein
LKVCWLYLQNIAKLSIISLIIGIVMGRNVAVIISRYNNSHQQTLQTIHHKVNQNNQSALPIKHVSVHLKLSHFCTTNSRKSTPMKHSKN